MGIDITEVCRVLLTRVMESAVTCMRVHVHLCEGYMLQKNRSTFKNFILNLE